MKILFGFIKGLLKLILVLVIFTFVISGLFLSMIYFSPPEQYAEWVEKGFVQATGQKLSLKGGLELAPGKTLNTTLKGSSITIPTKVGDVNIYASRFYLTIPWNAFYKQDFKLDTVEADHIQANITKDGKIIKTLPLGSFSGMLEKTCCELVVSNIKLVSMAGEATGEIKFFLTEPTLKVEGQLSAKKWLLDADLDPKLHTYAFEGINDLEGQIKFKIDTLVLPHSEMKNVEAVLDFKNKTLKVISADKMALN